MALDPDIFGVAPVPAAEPDSGGSCLDFLFTIDLSVLQAIEAAINAIIASLTAQLAIALTISLEKMGLAAFRKLTLAPLVVQLDALKELRKPVEEPIMAINKYCPELGAKIMPVLTTIDTLEAQLQSAVQRLNRLTFAADLANALVDTLQTKINSLLSFQNMLQPFIARAKLIKKVR